MRGKPEGTDCGRTTQSQEQDDEKNKGGKADGEKKKTFRSTRMVSRPISLYEWVTLSFPSVQVSRLLKIEAWQGRPKVLASIEHARMTLQRLSQPWVWLGSGGALDRIRNGDEWYEWSEDDFQGGFADDSKNRSLHAAGTR